MKSKSSRKHTQKAKSHAARLAVPTGDHMQAMLRHPQFQRALPLWKSIFAKNKSFIALTEEEQAERDAPTKPAWRLAAIMEADTGWLTHSIQDMRERGEDAWTFDAVNRPSGDCTHTVCIPLDLSNAAIRSCVAQVRKQSGVKPTQRLRIPGTPQIDKWEVYDKMQQKNATPAKVRDSLCGPYGRVDRRFSRQQRRLSPQDKTNVKRDLKRVISAYRFAKAMIKSLDSPRP